MEPTPEGARTTAASHELETEWGRWVQRLIPSAERVRFVSSGAEATLMAIRLAHGFTSRNKVVRFAGHFHGWHDVVMLGMQPPYDVPASAGIPDETLAQVICLPPNNIDAVERVLAADSEVACVILEPAGGRNAMCLPNRASWRRSVSSVPPTASSLSSMKSSLAFCMRLVVRRLTFNVTPDLTALGKILGGGLPGGAVAGRAEIMALLDSTDRSDPQPRIVHPGTFNANPLSAAAGIATLEIAASGEPQAQSGHLTDQLSQGMNDIS